MQRAQAGGPLCFLSPPRRWLRRQQRSAELLCPAHRNWRNWGPHCDQLIFSKARTVESGETGQATEIGRETPVSLTSQLTPAHTPVTEGSSLLACRVDILIQIEAADLVELYELCKVWTWSTRNQHGELDAEYWRSRVTTYKTAMQISVLSEGTEHWGCATWAHKTPSNDPTSHYFSLLLITLKLLPSYW